MTNYKDYYYKYKALKYYLKNNSIEKQKQIKGGMETNVPNIIPYDNNVNHSNDNNVNHSNENLNNENLNKHLTRFDRLNLILKVYNHPKELKDFTDDDKNKFITDLKTDPKKKIKINFRTVSRIFRQRKVHIQAALNGHMNDYILNNKDDKNKLTKEIMQQEAYNWISNIMWINDNDIISYLHEFVKNSTYQLPRNINKYTLMSFSLF